MHGFYVEKLQMKTCLGGDGGRCTVAPQSGSGLVSGGKSAHTGDDEWPQHLHDKDLCRISEKVRQLNAPGWGVRVKKILETLKLSCVFFP